MMIIMTFLITSVFILVMIMNLILFINIHKKMNREKNSAFECGFDCFSMARISFSVHFFIISLMFLIFDIEITLIFPIPAMKLFMQMNNWMLFSTLMMMLLITSLILEWKEGSMEWK
uniref:NADH dehydrogenase subunit 3 n=1 Tax=Egeirotrioza xingi TaxID=3132083 RepID=UPI0030FE06A2